jgi:uncharacterized LabA/DUF88 family protein
MTVAPPPKPGTPAMRALLGVVRGALDLPRAVVVIEGALDRKTMDELLQKATRGALGRVASLQRAEVVGRLADLFHRDEATATALVKELDRSAHKERHIVASIDEASLDERLQGYRALDFRRERARLVWALLRDGRQAHLRAATHVLDEAFAALAEKERVVEAAERATTAPDALAEDADALLRDLRQRLMGYEEALLEQQKQIQREVVHKEGVERERAELVARLGARERALRDEEALRRHDLAELTRLREQVATLEALRRDQDPARHQALEEEVLRLRERVRSLEKAAGRLERVAALEAELEALGRDAERARTTAGERIAELEQQLAQVLARERATQARLDEVREQLRDARQQLARGSQNPPPAPSSGRVGIFIDDANLSASARRDLGSRLDHLALLESLTDQRERAVALAFVVDAPETPRDKHDAFIRSLRSQGWDLREKRAKVRHDGSRKADWDMGMAMEILDHVDDIDVVVLGTGDGDFVPLVKRLRRLGKRVEVAAFRASTDDSLIAAADLFIALDGRFRLNR